MQHASKKKDEGLVSEMAIVNTFTKLIFGDDAYTARELSIIEAFRVVDANVLRDSRLEMGGYLRDLGVREMIQLVARVHRHITQSMGILSSPGKQKSRSTAGVHSNQGRSTR